MKRALVLLLLGCVVEYGYGQEFLPKGKVALDVEGHDGRRSLRLNRP